MPVQYWESLQNAGAPWQTASGTTLNTAATATLSPEGSGTGTDYLVPAYGYYVGFVQRIFARGVYTNGSTATNATFTLSTGTPGTSLTTSSGVLAATSALPLPPSQTNLYWELFAIVQCRAVAAGTGTPTLYTHGSVWIQTGTPSGTTGNMQCWPMPATAGPTAANIDTTIAHSIGLVGTLSQATGSPAITCTQFTVEAQD